jgi:hypothetical protein
MPSERENAQTPCIECFAQMSGFVWRQPTVRISESAISRGAWNRRA